ncbi:MAG: hypothetical protein AB1540_12145 [Bdellovibrionota bacterium]
MAPKIERVWGSLFAVNPNAVKRKEGSENGQPDDQREKRGRQNPSEEQGQKAPKQADRADVERAINDLKSADPFTQAGLRVEMMQTAEGLSVRLLQHNGTVLKTMSAEEFLKLRESSAADQTRGKILDQKF